MNCQKGDLAIVVKSYGDLNLGKVVRCVSFMPAAPYVDGTFLDSWNVDRPLPSIDGGLAPYVPDAWLRPIRPEADPVTTDVVAGVEA